MLPPTDDPMMTRNSRGLTLIELIVATTILIVLSGMAIPMSRITIKRERAPAATGALGDVVGSTCIKMLLIEVLSRLRLVLKVTRRT